MDRTALYKTAADWASTNPTMQKHEHGVETDTLLEKVGNGTSAWNDLGYINGAVLGGLSWEKYSVYQTIPHSAAPAYPYTTLTDWQAAPHQGAGGILAAAFNPTTGIFTPPLSGWYSMSWQVHWAANPTGFRYAASGFTIATSLLLASPAGATSQNGHGMIFADAPGGGWHFARPVIQVEQGSGGDLNIQYAQFSVVFLGGMISEQAPA